MAATVKAPATQKRRPPAPRPALPPAPPEPPGLLHFTAVSDEPEEREPLFYIDGTEYSIPLDPPATIAINATHIIATGGPSAGAMAEDYLMTEMLGEDGFAALRNCKTVKLDDYRHLVEVCTRRAMGQPEEGEAPNR